MVSDGDDIISRKRRKISPHKAAPYIFKPLFDQVPVAADDAEGGVHITCVEYWSEFFWRDKSARS